jgi:transposase-like protein
METHLLPNVRGNVQTLRNMWSEKLQEEQKLLKPKSVTFRTPAQVPHKSSIKDKTQAPNETVIHKEATVKFADESRLIK